MTDNLFNDGGDPSTTSSTTQDRSTDNAPYLVVGDREYKSPDDVVKKISAADEHIKRLEQETAEWRQKLEEAEKRMNNATSMDSILEAVRKELGSDTQTQRTQALNPEDLRGMVEKTVKDFTVTEQRTRNLNFAQEKFIEQLGEGDPNKAKSKLTDLCRELGVGLDYAQNLASTSPNAFFKLFGVNTTTTTSTGPTAPSPGRVNTSAFNTNSNNEDGYAALTKAYKEAKSSKEKSTIMTRIEMLARTNPNYKQT